ncbi:MAG: hypothetical protein PUP91_16440 [Rhizonema sp. PD37]|nr:hypothetical protein [Rhizonema sp. PD37]
MSKNFASLYLKSHFRKEPELNVSILTSQFSALLRQTIFTPLPVEWNERGSAKVTAIASDASCR